MNKISLLWAYKVFRSKYFVILTDKDAVIKLDGKDVASLNDRIILTSQAVTLTEFYKRLGKLIIQHEKKIDAIAKKQALKEI